MTPENQKGIPASLPPGTNSVSPRRTRLIPILVWAILLGGYALFAWRNDLSSIEALLLLADFFRSPVGPVIFVAAYVARPLIFFPATLITVAAGSFFGPVGGIILTIIGSNASALLAFGVGRYFGEDILRAQEKFRTLLDRYAAPLRRNSFETVIIMRFLFLPYDLVNYASGFLQINWRAFLLATFLGSLPGTFAFVLFGASLEFGEAMGRPTIDYWTLAASLLMVAVSLLISRLVKQRQLGGVHEPV